MMHLLQLPMAGKKSGNRINAAQQKIKPIAKPNSLKAQNILGALLTAQG